MAPSSKPSADGPGPFALDMSPEAFRDAGYRLIDALAEFYASLPERPVTRAETRAELGAVFPARPLPARGEPTADLLADITERLIEHSLHNGHPRFFGYITSSAAPLGALADLLAAGINPNCALRDIAPAAYEIERQTVDWLAELIGFPRPCGGIMVSGGNMANMLAFFAARHAMLPWPVRREGLRRGEVETCVYASRGTHTWLEKTMDIAGFGTDSVRWVATDRAHRMLVDELEEMIESDRAAGRLPFFVVGTAGNVSTGAIDPLPEIADIAKRVGMWFHIDGAYGAPAAVLPDAPEPLRALEHANSVALDPHKWLYTPIEAACTLVRDPAALANALSYRPSYYRFEEADAHELNYYEQGLQNTRGFRALKVWLCMRQTGREGYAQRIRRDIELARLLHARIEAAPDLEAGTQHLSITTFRYRPPDLSSGSKDDARYLDELNTRLVQAAQTGGEVFVSNAVLDGRQFARACIVNFRTSEDDIDALIDAVTRLGRAIDTELRGMH